MSYLSRTLKKQKRELNNLKQSPILSLKGFGYSEILVFQVYYKSYSEIEMKEDCLHMESEISRGKYKDLKEFDSYYTTDIEFSNLYFGKKKNQYHSQTKRQLIEVGQVWRTRVKEKYPSSDLKIVVHFDKEMDAWFLDTFNWDIKPEWRGASKTTIWL